jgi:hypothetical protein
MNHITIISLATPTNSMIHEKGIILAAVPNITVVYLKITSRYVKT